MALALLTFRHLSALLACAGATILEVALILRELRRPGPTRILNVIGGAAILLGAAAYGVVTISDGG